MNAISNHSTPDERPSRRSACRTLGRLAHKRSVVRASTDALIDPKSFASKRRPRRHQLIGPQHRRVGLDADHDVLIAVALPRLADRQVSLASAIPVSPNGKRAEALLRPWRSALPVTCASEPVT